MSTETDIRLETGQVIIDAWDLCLDSKDRRDPDHMDGHRRALVHDFEDGLTVNWANDYPGGVTLNGVRAINAHGSPDNRLLLSGAISCEDLVDIKGGIRLVAGGLSWTRIFSDDNQRLVVEAQGNQNTGIVFKGPVRFEGEVSLSQFVGEPGLGGAMISYEDLLMEIVKLQQEIGGLKERIAALEA